MKPSLSEPAGPAPALGTAAPPARRFGRGMDVVLPAVFVLLLAGLLLGPLWSYQGLPNSADGVLHLHRAAAVTRAWSAGVLWPRWFPDVYQGLGAPVFHFYSPLFYILLAPLHGLGVPLDTAAKLVLSAAFVLSGLALWAWLRRLFTPLAGLVGATLYLSQPLLFRDYYFQGDYPQVLALFWLPVVFWSFTRLSLDGRRIDWVLAPSCLAVLALTHNITTMLGGAMLALYWLGLAAWHRDRRWWRVPAGCLLAAGLSAFFWLPMLADLDLVQIGNASKEFFYFGQYFLPWADLLAAPPTLDSRAANPPFPHMLGWAAWLAVAAGLVTLLISVVRRPARAFVRTPTLIGLVLVAFCVALTQRQSEPLWTGIGLLALAQFPSRWLGPAALGVAMAGAGTVAAFGPRRSWLPALALLLAAALASAVFVFPRPPYLQMASLSPADTRAYELASGVWGMTGGDEFLPRWAGPPVPNAGALAVSRWLPNDSGWAWESPHRVELRAPTGEEFAPGTLVVPLHYFPAWQATADGSPVPTAPAAAGLSGIDLSRPAQSVVIEWQGTRWQIVGQAITIVTALLLAAGAVLAWQRRKSCKTPEPGDSTERAYTQWSVVAVVAALLLTRIAIQSLDLGWFQRSSPPGTVVGVTHPLQVELGTDQQPRVRLIGWELLSGAVRPGDELRLRLYWHAPVPIRQDLHSFAQLYVPALRRSWAGVQNDNPGRIPTSRWRTELYYVDDLVVPLPPELPPTGYTIAVGMTTSGDQRLAAAGNQDNMVLLGQVQAEPAYAGWGQVKEPTTAAPALFSESLKLQGYDLLPDPGGLLLRLYWQVRQRPAANLVVFVHLLDEQGRLIAQFDGPPLDNLLPTSQWQRDWLLIDRRALALSPELLAKGSRLLVGLYDSITQVRLAARPEGASADRFAGDALVIPLTSHRGP